MQHEFTVERTPSLILNNRKHPANIRYSFVKEYIKGKDVLEIGCGNVDIFKHLDSAKSVFVIDYNPQIIRKLKNKNKSSKFDFAVYCLPELPKKKFDCIICFEVIEHITKSDAKKLLRNFKKVLRRNGRLIISTPNKKMYSPYTDFPLDCYHLYEYTYEEIKKMLEKEVKIVDTKYISLSKSKINFSLALLWLLRDIKQRELFLLSPFLVISQFLATLISVTKVKIIDVRDETAINFIFVCKLK